MAATMMGISRSNSVQKCPWTPCTADDGDTATVTSIDIDNGASAAGRGKLLTRSLLSTSYEATAYISMGHIIVQYEATLELTLAKRKHRYCYPYCNHTYSFIYSSVPLVFTYITNVKAKFKTIYDYLLNYRSGDLQTAHCRDTHNEQFLSSSTCCHVERLALCYHQQVICTYYAHSTALLRAQPTLVIP